LSSTGVGEISKASECGKGFTYVVLGSSQVSIGFASMVVRGAFNLREEKRR